MPFDFRRRTEAALRRAARLRKVFSTAQPARLKNDFIPRSEPCYMKKFWHASAQRLSTASKIGQGSNVKNGLKVKQLAKQSPTLKTLM